MHDKDLYTRILGITAPWQVTDVVLDATAKEVRVALRCDPDAPVACPDCEAVCPRHDHRERSWRHLDTCQYRTLLTAAVPRVRCALHGVRQVRTPWADPGSRFTALFEQLAIDWMLEVTLAGGARLLSLTWAEAHGIRVRAVRRGLARREAKPLEHMGVDEKHQGSRAGFVTIVSDAKESNVLHVADGRDKEALMGYYLGEMPLLHRFTLESISMDLGGPFISATKECFGEDAERLIAFDRFHVAKLMNEAVDEVRRKEHKELMAEGDKRLSNSRYDFVSGAESLDNVRLARLDAALDARLKTAEAWSLKETARDLWAFVTRKGARRGWKQWIAAAKKSGLGPMMRVGKTVMRHIDGIINAIVNRVSNAGAESINAKIQRIITAACGFRSRESFKTAIYFFCGGLDMRPHALLTHTKS